MVDQQNLPEGVTAAHEMHCWKLLKFVFSCLCICRVAIDYSEISYVLSQCVRYQMDLCYIEEVCLTEQ